MGLGPRIAGRDRQGQRAVRVFGRGPVVALLGKARGQLGLAPSRQLGVAELMAFREQPVSVLVASSWSQSVAVREPSATSERVRMIRSPGDCPRAPLQPGSCLRQQVPSVPERARGRGNTKRQVQRRLGVGGNRQDRPEVAQLVIELVQTLQLPSASTDSASPGAGTSRPPTL